MEEKKGLVGWFKANNTKIRSITNLIGGILLFLCGLVFIIIVDLKVNKFDPITYKDAAGEEQTYKIVLSLYLLLGAILSFGGGIFFLFGDSRKHKHTQTLVLKAVGMVLAIAFIFFLFSFKNGVDCYRHPALHFPEAGFAEAKYFIDEKIYNTANTVVSVCLALDIIALVILAVNYVFSILFIEEDY